MNGLMALTNVPHELRSDAEQRMRERRQSRGAAAARSLIIIKKHEARSDAGAPNIIQKLLRSFFIFIK